MFGDVVYEEERERERERERESNIEKEKTVGREPRDGL